MYLDRRDCLLEQATKGSSACSVFIFIRPTVDTVLENVFSQIKVTGVDKVVLEKIERICNIREKLLGLLVVCSCFACMNL